MEEQRYARLITMKAKRGRGDEFRKVFEREVVPTAKKLKGMRRLYLLREAGKKDEFVVISMWRSERDAENYAKSGRNREYAKRLGGVQSGRERVKKLHVTIHAVGGSARR